MQGSQPGCSSSTAITQLSTKLLAYGASFLTARAITREDRPEPLSIRCEAISRPARAPPGAVASRFRWAASSRCKLRKCAQARSRASSSWTSKAFTEVPFFGSFPGILLHIGFDLAQIVVFLIGPTLSRKLEPKPCRQDSPQNHGTPPMK